MTENWRLAGDLFVTVAMWLSLMMAPPALADNAGKLKVLLISTRDETQELGLSYTSPALNFCSQITS
ncbi:hypothetical protein [Nitrosomonas communis]|uniref:Uncharacterized protein n=1 Tax=Nitrosomonas communis TaxID=44574 RepID=A0A1I4NAX9_9PROT|nr:hypothetical protein [Nitrosomonas communis]SFM12535.1 hypothetical protein SAMN05421863_101412 [Nitrosomonas communis]